MFPVSDFSFVACGMATVAATVGYVCAKKLRSDLPPHRLHEPSSSHISDQEVVQASIVEKPPLQDEPPLASIESFAGVIPLPNGTLVESQDCVIKQVAEEIAEPSTIFDMHAAEPNSKPVLEPVIVVPAFVPAPPMVERRRSLKRKQMHDHDENNIPLEYPFNLTALYPNKRNKTPPRETPTADDKNVLVAQAVICSQEVEVKLAMQPEAKRQQCMTEQEEPQASVPSLPEISKVESSVEPCKAAPLDPKPTSTSTSIPNQEGDKVESSVEPCNAAPPEPKPTSTSNPNEVSKAPPSLPPPPSPPAVAFEAFATSRSTLSFGNAGSLASGTSARPAWSSTSSFRKRHGFVDAVDDSPNSSQLRSRSESPPHAIGSSPPAAQSTYSHMTGEEDEDIKYELKGAKLFVKRGSKDFSGGMLGHVKLLSNKKTLDERLLFRREPLWKVSMNTRLRPTVRCTFDTEECILRLVLAESVEQTGSSSIGGGEREIVVYALKPGRFCPKRDFQDFAQAVLANKNLGPGDAKN